MQRSFLKWAGGKANALDHVFTYVPQQGERLIEPFMGSCTVALNTDYRDYVLNDFNPDLVHLCSWVAKRPKEVIELARPLFVPENNTKAQFVMLRARYNASRNVNERALLFLYLNRHCYNGLMRYNMSGGYNTTFGKYKNPKLPEAEMLAFSKKLKHARFVCGGFQSVRFVSTQDVNVYCDPPYLPLTPTASFVGYNANGFNQPDHKLLNRKCRQWKKGCGGVWLSNHDVPLIESCYSDAVEKHTFQVTRTISQNAQNRQKADEVLLAY